MDPIRIITVDVQFLFRYGIQRLLEQEEDMEIVGEAGDVAGALAVVEAYEPAVILLDINLPGDAMDLARQIRRIAGGTAIIMLTNVKDEEQLFQAVKVGAAAYYPKDIDGAALIAAVRRVSRHEYLINDDVLGNSHVAGRVLSGFREIADMQVAGSPIYVPLTAREIEVLERIAGGNSNKQIASILTITDQTVKNHITSILRKLAANDRTHAAVIGLQNHWINFPE